MFYSHGWYKEITKMSKRKPEMEENSFLRLPIRLIK